MNAAASRRAELRKLAQANIAAQAIPFLKQRLIPGANGVFEHTTGGKRAVQR